MNNEIAKETALSTLKVVIGSIPYIGSAINEFAIDLRGRIKQERVNKFIYEFGEYINQFYKVSLDISQIKKEEFGDFFEDLIISVWRTQSETKRDAFKKLLYNHIVKKNHLEYAEIYLNLINTLHEKQILIISRLTQTDTDGWVDIHREILERNQEIISLEKQKKLISEKIFDKDELNSDENIQDINNRIENLKKEMSVHQRRLEIGFEGFQSTTYGLDYPDFFFFLQDLCNKGLLVDRGVQSGAPPFQLLDVTNFAFEFIEYIKAAE